MLVAWVVIPAVASHGKILATGECHHHIPRMAIGRAGQVLQHIALDMILGQRPAGGLQVYAPSQVPLGTKGSTYYATLLTRNKNMHSLIYVYGLYYIPL